MSDKEPQYIYPPTTLQQKVKELPQGMEKILLQQANEAILEMADEYLGWVIADIDNLEAQCSMALKDPDNRADHIQNLYLAAHEIKGQGGSFGYPLMTALGGHLCRYIETLDYKMTDGQLEVVKVCVDSMRLVIAERMEGDGGKMGEQLLKGLSAAIEKRSA